MEKNEFRVVIKHLHERLNAERNQSRVSVHSTSASAFASAYNWVNEFKCISTCASSVRNDNGIDVDSMSISDWHYHFWLSRSRRPIEAATPEIIDKVHDIVLIDEWKCASLLRPQAYHMAQWFQFCTSNWV